MPSSSMSPNCAVCVVVIAVAGSTCVPSYRIETSPVVFQVQGKYLGEFLHGIVEVKRPVVPVQLRYLDLNAGGYRVNRILVPDTYFADVIFKHGDLVGA